MRQICLLVLLLCAGVQLFAQEPIRFGDREVYLEANVRSSVRGRKTSSLELGVPVGDKLNVLVQFEATPLALDVLQGRGIELGDYLGSNAYYARIAPGSRPSDFVGMGLRSIVPIRAEWKVVNSLLQHDIPEWAQAGDKLRMTLSWFPTLTGEKVKSLLAVKEIRYTAFSDALHSAEVEATYEQLLALAAEEFVAFLRWIDPPKELQNREGARLSGAATLRIPAMLGGRNLTGRGVRIGIWDGNVLEHVDYGNQTHCEEAEYLVAATQAHGMHTTGTIIGAGLLDERARGMAPEAEIWTWNFNRHSNGKSVALEMLETYEAHQISLTSNSYGYQVSRLCGQEARFNYTYFGYQGIDFLASYIPTLTHVFSAGNDQGACGRPFSHASNYAKNIISVAAVNQYGAMTDFSSFGPLLDGRMFPIISARGEQVYSTVNNQSYRTEDGTSMSCPMVTGHLALLTQRWMQLHGGAVPYNYYLKALVANTARDAGVEGPDYKFGFGILDAEAAVTAMEKSWHALGELPQGGDAKTYTLDVPAGTGELRVMLCWNDPMVNKEYATGECPLVNDLDLVVAQGATKYFPFTLDPKQPTAPAVADKKNEVDNIEQVVIKNPMTGTYTVTVGGTVHQGKKQPYAVVWYFDEQTPTLASPAVGDVYAPDESVYLRAEHLTGNVHVELSTDAGATFRDLGSYPACSSFKLPSDVALTDKALVRLTDANGVMLRMQGYFTIMPQVQNLVLEDAACSSEGWKLSWDAATGAEKYEILRGNVTAGQYEKLAEVNAPTTEYSLSADQITTGRNVYAVRAISATGLAGRRSTGVLSMKPHALALKSADLPYLESFEGWPLHNASVSRGRNLKFEAQEAPAVMGLPKGAQMMIWVASTSAHAWQDPFKNFARNIGALNVCNLDLTGIAKGTELELVAYIYMKKPTMRGGSLLRLLVNDEEQTDTQGRAQIVGDGEEHRVAWDLTRFAGENISLRFETALRTKNDATILSYYQIIEKTKYPDIGLAWVNDPEIEAKVNMQEENIRFKVRNNSSQELHNVPVTVLVDGTLAYSETLEMLKPFEDRVLTCTHNFASADAHRYKVEIRVDVEGDLHADNNAGTFEVYNIGDVVAMPELTYTEVNNSVASVVPYKSVSVSGVCTFVDGRGALAPYNRDEEAVLQILPSRSNATVQVTFSEYDFAAGDTLAIFTGNVPSDLHVSFKEANAYLTGKTNTPHTFISEADNGGLTFFFMGSNREPAAGWIAEVREVPLVNQWKLSALTLTDVKDENHKQIHAQIENLLPTFFYNVGLMVTLNGSTERVEIPTLVSGANDFVLPQTLDVTAPSRITLACSLAKDGDMSDNRQELTLVNDPIWHDGTIKKERELYIRTIAAKGSNDLTVEASKQLIYKIQHIVPLYATSKNGIEVTLSTNPTQQKLPSQLRLWIDANGNNKLEDSEATVAELMKGQKKYWLDVDLSHIADLKTGKCRARLILSTAEDYALFKENKEIEWGCVVDFTADVKQGVSPYAYELAVLSVEDLKTGRNLSNATPVRVKLRNNGLAAQERVHIAYQLDENQPVTEELACSLAARGGEAVVEFEQKADLSRTGKHTLKIMLTDKDENEEDNTKLVKVYCIPPKGTDLYSLQFVGNRKEALYLPDVGKAIVGQVDKMTFEGWWKLNETQACEFINGSGLWLASLSGQPEYPDNTLIFMAGENGAFVSEKPVLTPGKWQHIAVSVVQKGFFKVQATPTVYIDGEEIEMKKLGGAEVRFSHLWLNGGLSGNHAMFRLWKKACTQQEIKDNMMKSVRLADGKLPDECVGEYLFTEGNGRVTAYGDERFALILSERNDVWQPLQGVVSGVTIEKQKRAAQFTSADNITVTMPNDFTAFDKVKAQFSLHWLGAKVMQNAQEVTDATELDFSNSEHKLHFSAQKTDLFGTTLSQEFDITLVKERSDACDLLKLSLLKTNNLGLKKDVVVENPDRVIVLEVENESTTTPLDVHHVTLVVNSISEHAKLYNGAAVILPGQAFEVDLSTPVPLRVEAQNGRDAKNYMVRLSMPQSIVWEETQLEYTYTGTPIALTATATSQLPVGYYSLDPNIVTVDAYGHLVTVGVGKTILVATQVGSHLYKPAESKQREVIVTPANLIIKIANITMAQGDTLPEFDFTYEVLQFPETEHLVEHPYEIRKADGSVWSTEMLPLAVGSYTIAPKGYSAPYEAGNYRITCESGTLTVTAPQKAQEVTFLAKDESNAALRDVLLRWTGMQPTLTPSDGTVKVYLRPGQYHVLATKAGYKRAEQSFVVDSTAMRVELQLLKEVHTLTYTAGEHGMLQGNLQQKVADGQDGTMVIAVANGLQYRFKQWSDGSKMAARIDKNVRDNVAVSAEFETYHYTITYEMSEGGEWVAGESSQSVVPGEDGTPVTVKEKAGYMFTGWSDGIPDRERTDRNVLKDVTVKALFVKARMLTWSENFELGTTALQNWTFGVHEKGQGWQLRPMNELKELASPSGNVLAIAPLYETGYNYYEHCWVATPWLSLEDRDASAEVVLSYVRYYKKSTNTWAMVEYSFEDGVWHVGKTISAGTSATPETFKLDAATLATHKYIRYRWYFSNQESLSAYLALDDIVVKFDPEPTATNPTLRYFAGEHGGVKKASAMTGVPYLEFVGTGTDADEVTAVANEGYQFEKWSDGNLQATRKDATAVTVEALFIEQAKQTYVVQYLAGANGTLLGLPYQEVEAGKSSAAVTAVASEGYEFKAWDDGKSEATRSDIVTESKTFTALFTQYFTLSYTAGEHGRIEGVQSQKVEKGANGTAVKAIADAGYRFVQWSDGMTEATRTDTNVTEDKTYTASFEKIQAPKPEPKTYAVTLTVEGEGELSIAGYTKEQLAKVAENTELTVVATPKDAEWELATLTAGGENILATSKFTVKASVEVKAVFAKKSAPQPQTFAVTFTKEGEGTLTITGIEADKLNAVPAGTELTAVATPATGWKLKNLMAGDKDIASDGKFTVTANVEVKAVFEKTTAVDDAVFANVLVAPNPFIAHLRLVCNGATGRYDLLNAQSIVVRSGNMAGNEVLIETTDLPSGLYLLRLTATNGATEVVTIVKD